MRRTWEARISHSRSSHDACGERQDGRAHTCTCTDSIAMHFDQIHLISVCKVTTSK